MYICVMLYVWSMRILHIEKAIKYFAKELTNINIDIKKINFVNYTLRKIQEYLLYRAN